MKANSPKRKVFQDALDLLTEDMAVDKAVSENGILQIAIDKITPFHDHPFRLYEGERLADMVQSIREHGVLNPVIVRRTKKGFEMLAGHNRANAAKLAGLKEIPAIVKDKLTEEEAYVYVIETNLIQRSFTDLLPSEKAAVLKERHEKISCQGKRNDIVKEIAALEGASQKSTCGHSDHKLRSRDSVGKEYELSGSSVSRLMRLNHLIPEFKEQVDDGRLPFMAAVHLSYLNEEEQNLICQVAEQEGKKIRPKQAEQLRKRNGKIDREAAETMFRCSEKSRAEKKTVRIWIDAGVYNAYLADVGEADVSEIMEKALKMYFGKAV